MSDVRTFLRALAARGHSLSADDAVRLGRLWASLEGRDAETRVDAVASLLARSEPEFLRWRQVAEDVLAPVVPEAPESPRLERVRVAARYDRMALVVSALLAVAIAAALMPWERAAGAASIAAATMSSWWGTPTPDEDEDGTPDSEDCDPAQPTVHPGATEVCGNGRDDDCSGAEDDVPAYSPDADGDGYGVERAPGSLCDVGKPAGAEGVRGAGSLAANGGDCDDTRVDVHPGLPDLTTDGLDQDCDGQDGPPEALAACPPAPDWDLRPSAGPHRAGGAALGALVAAALLLRSRRRHRRVEEARAELDARGGHWFTLDLPAFPGTPDLARSFERGPREGETTLDVAATVRETARRNLPVLRWRRLGGAQRVRLLVEVGPAMAPWRDRVEGALRELTRRVEGERWTFTRDGRARGPNGRTARVADLVGDPGTVLVGLGRLDPAAGVRADRQVWLCPMDDPAWWPPEASRVWPLDARGVENALAAARGERPSSPRAPHRRLSARDRLRATWLAGLVPDASPAEIVAFLATLDPGLPAEAVVGLDIPARGTPAFAEAWSRAEEALRKAGDPLRGREVEVREAALARLRASEPPKGTAGHLRWRRDEALARLGIGADRDAVATLDELARGPLRVELGGALDRQVGVDATPWARIRRRLRRELPSEEVPWRGTQWMSVATCVLLGIAGGEAARGLAAPAAPSIELVWKDEAVIARGFGPEGGEVVLVELTAEGPVERGRASAPRTEVPSQQEAWITVEGVGPGACLQAYSTDPPAFSRVLQAPGAQEPTVLTLRVMTGNGLSLDSGMVRLAREGGPNRMVPLNQATDVAPGPWVATSGMDVWAFEDRKTLPPGVAVEWGIPARPVDPVPPVDIVVPVLTPEPAGPPPPPQAPRTGTVTVRIAEGKRESGLTEARAGQSARFAIVDSTRTREAGEGERIEVAPGNVTVSLLTTWEGVTVTPKERTIQVEAGASRAVRFTATLAQPTITTGTLRLVPPPGLEYGDLELVAIAGTDVPARSVESETTTLPPGQWMVRPRSVGSEPSEWNDARLFYEFERGFQIEAGKEAEVDLSRIAPDYGVVILEGAPAGAVGNNAFADANEWAHVIISTARGIDSDYHVPVDPSRVVLTPPDGWTGKPQPIVVTAGKVTRVRWPFREDAGPARYASLRASNVRIEACPDPVGLGERCEFTLLLRTSAPESDSASEILLCDLPPSRVGQVLTECPAVRVSLDPGVTITGCERDLRFQAGRCSGVSDLLQCTSAAVDRDGTDPDRGVAEAVSCRSSQGAALTFDLDGTWTAEGR